MTAVYCWFTHSPRETCSQYLLSLQTLPMPSRSSHLLMPALRSLTSPVHTAPTQRLRPSFIRSLSMARLVATSAGATCPMPGAHSAGRTQRSTSSLAGGRTASRRDRQMEAREWASLREATLVLVRKMERRASSRSVGREGEERRDARRARLCRRRRMWRIGARDRSRRWREVCGKGKGGCRLVPHGVIRAGLQACCKGLASLLSTWPADHTLPESPRYEGAPRWAGH